MDRTEMIREHIPLGERRIDPLALRVRLVDGYDAADDRILTNPAVIVEPVPHPVLHYAIEAAGGQPRGSWTFSVGLGDQATSGPLHAAMRHCPHQVVPETGVAATRQGSARKVWRHRSNPISMVHGTPFGLTEELRRAGYFPTPDWHDARSWGMLTASMSETNFYLKFRTHQTGILEKILDGSLCSSEVMPGRGDVDLGFTPRLDVWPADRSQRRDPTALHGARAAQALFVLHQRFGFDLVDGDGLSGLADWLLEAASSRIIAWPDLGRPAQARVTVGSAVPEEASLHFGDAVDRSEARQAVEGRVPASTIAELDPTLRQQYATVDDSLDDVVDIAGAVPLVRDDLRAYQEVIVGQTLATRYGFVNALPPGMGKTVTTLVAANEIAERAEHPARTLVICKASLRPQWEREQQLWLTGHTTVVIDGAHKAGELADALDSGEPVFVLVSPELAKTVIDAEPRDTEPPEAVERDLAQMALFDAEAPDRTWQVDDEDDTVTLGSVLASVHWDFVVNDEAVGLRNTGTKTAQALWQIRENADVALALTGTPIVRGLDDLGRILAWTRLDKAMFNGVRLSANFDLAEDDGMWDFAEAMGPLVFREDKAAIAGELPTITSRVVDVELSVAERELAQHAEHQLKRDTEAFVAELDLAEQARARSDDDAAAARVRELREEIATRHAAWMGSITIARMAAADPASLQYSQAQAAAILEQRGLLAEATQEVGSKRRWLLDFVDERVGDGQQILVFTDFASVATELVGDMRDRGISAAAFVGGGGAARDANLLRFQDGEHRVLVASSSGEHGLNLQMASVVVHYDLPWTPDRIEQRTGRIERIGSENDRAEVIFPIARGTIEERVAGLVVARAMTQMRALDAHRGANLAETELGRALGNLSVRIPPEVLKGKERKLLALTREILAAGEDAPEDAPEAADAVVEAS